MIPLPRLYAIADASFGDPLEIARRLFEGGARLIQIRNKSAGSGPYLEQVEQVLKLAPDDAYVIVNDRADIALLSHAHGLHIGQDDLPAEPARAILGEKALIGLSTHNIAQAMKADLLLVDYIAVGPIFPTASKSNPDPVLGLDSLSEICRTVRKPVVAIGGITLESAPDVFAAGAASIAVIGDLLRFADLAGRTNLWVRSTSCSV